MAMFKGIFKGPFVGSFVAGIAVGVLLGGGWFLNMGAPTAQMGASTGATTTPLVSSTGGAVAVANQAAGDSVIVESVTVPPPGVWVAVREMQGSEMGNVLGAARAKGPRTNFTVPLLRATVPGQRYAIELYRDDAGGQFTLNNSVYVDFDTGARVIAYFNTTN